MLMYKERGTPLLIEEVKVVCENQKSKTRSIGQVTFSNMTCPSAAKAIDDPNELANLNRHQAAHLTTIRKHAFSLHALAALPAVAGVGSMAHETKVTVVATLAERLGADEVGVGQAAVVDDVGVAAHGTELHEITRA